MSALDRLVELIPVGDGWDDDDIDARLERMHALSDELAAGGDHCLVPRLEELLENYVGQGEDVGRDAIALILHGIAGVDALPVLLRAASVDLGDDQDTLDSLLVDLLDESSQHHPAVLEALAAEDPGLRATAVWALDFGLTEADLPHLLTASEDADSRVREMAIGPLAHLAAGQPAARDAMVAAVRQDNARIRARALARLSALTFPGREELFAACVNDPDPTVAAIARRVSAGLSRFADAGAPEGGAIRTRGDPQFLLEPLPQ